MERTKYNRIKVVLAEHDKTNIWLADELDVSLSTVSTWCSNKRQPDIITLFKIADLLEIDVRELLISNKKV